MVAKDITVLTKKYDAKTGYKFESDGVKTYTIEEDDSLTDSGTEIILKLISIHYYWYFSFFVSYQYII